jgi:leucyl/phenylalanyl-tRNA--protein transferase
MAIKQFPPVDLADEHGLLAVGGDLEPESIICAYQSGIFPWPLDSRTLAWFAPPVRCVLFLDEFHVSRSVTRNTRHAGFTTAINTSFREVIMRCAEVVNRGDQDGTWITPAMIDAYIQLHELGVAHSFEAFFDDTLVGGIYGVQVGRFFAAESSFYRKDNASKVAMIRMVEYLREQGISWFDCQVLTPFSEGFGACEITRDEFMTLLAQTREAGKPLSRG